MCYEENDDLRRFVGWLVAWMLVAKRNGEATRGSYPSLSNPDVKLHALRRGWKSEEVPQVMRLVWKSDEGPQATSMGCYYGEGVGC